MTGIATAQRTSDSWRTIAADYVRVIWQPTAVFRRQRDGRIGRRFWALAAVGAIIALVPFTLALFDAGPLAHVQSDARDRHGWRDAGPLMKLLMLVILSPFAGIMLGVIAFVEALAVAIAARALRTRVTYRNAFIIAAYGLTAALPVFVLQGVLYSVGGFDGPLARVAALNLDGTFAPDSSIVSVVLSAIGVIGIWIAIVHGIGLRELAAGRPPVHRGAAASWAASVLLTIALGVLLDPLANWSERTARDVNRQADSVGATAPAP